MRTGLALIAALCAALLAPAARAEGDVAHGRKIAVQHCSRCHVVGDTNPHGGINSTPSFQLLARRDDWRDRFATFHARRPHPVFVRVPDVEPWTGLPSPVEPFTVTVKDIEDILSFVATLAPK